ncbi:MAG TPA: DUF2065 domain-containing protein [Rhodanobacteraceae bacterium]|nr:DUF2065 domain-containing protein [Rhodanobacteraceae bacterium]
MHELSAALCLVLVIEGMILLAAPRGWQKMVEQAARMDPRLLRACGGVAVVAGLLVLQLVNR